MKCDSYVMSLFQRIRWYVATKEATLYINLQMKILSWTFTKLFSQFFST